MEVFLLDLQKMKISLCWVVLILFCVSCGPKAEYKASTEAMLLQKAEQDVIHIIDMTVSKEEQGLMKAIVPLYLNNVKRQIRFDKYRVYITPLDIEYAYKTVPVYGPFKAKFAALAVYQKQLK